MTASRRDRRAAAAIAARPPARTVTWHGRGPWDGWEVTARADFPARLLVDLQSSEVAKIVAVLETIVLEHNLPDSTGARAATMGDVDPWDGLIAATAGIVDALARLPSR